MKTKISKYILLLLSILAIFGCKKHTYTWVTHRCEDNDHWTRNYEVRDDLYYVYRCDMCLTEIEINNGKIIKENKTNKRNPVNTWLE